MKRIFCLLCLLLFACGPSAEQLFETAEFELLQTNYQHATKLYRQIIEQHPDSEMAATAQQRLEEIKARQVDKPAPSKDE